MNHEFNARAAKPRLQGPGRTRKMPTLTNGEVAERLKKRQGLPFLTHELAHAPGGRVAGRDESMHWS